jgi:DNA-binding transcriptional MocR family regulator
MIDLLHSSGTVTSAKALTLALEARVREGRLPPGARLPTVRQLARQTGLSPTTVAAAFRALVQRGVVETAGRLGTRVNPRPPLSVPRPEAVADPALRDLATGNPDPELLPRLRPALRGLDLHPPLYGGPPAQPELLRLAQRDLLRDGIPATRVAFVSGAMDGIERVLQAHLQPGDRVAVEDPGYTAVLDLLAAMGLRPEAVPLDDLGLKPAALAAALRRGPRACILTPRAQNPTGAALDAHRARELREVLGGHPDVLVVEDDHAGPIAGARAWSTVPGGHGPWAVVRSVSKWLGPDLRLAFLTGDETTVSRVEGRQSLGSGWVSHLLQATAARLWSGPGTVKRLRAAAVIYEERRRALLLAVRRRHLKASGRSGLNVWINVPEEAAVVAALAARGWAVRAGESYRLESPPAIRVTTAALEVGEAERFADDLQEVLRPRRRIALA